MLLTVTALPPDVILVGGVVLLMLTNILTPAEALAGMANEGMITVGVLFIVVPRSARPAEWSGSPAGCSADPKRRPRPSPE